MIQSFFSTLGSLVSIYSFICLIRILMSWIPDLEYSQAGRFIAGLCDPWLNWFRRFKFTRIGMVDFSPVLALGVLSVASMAFSTFAMTGQISIAVILSGLLQVVWSFFSFFLNILILFLVIRLIYDLVSRYSYSPFWTMLDRFLNPPIAKITAFFHSGKPLSYRMSLIVTLVTVIVLRVALTIGINALAALIRAIPF